jgi:hypothetical protein
MLAQCFALGVQCISIINVIEEYAKYIRCEGKVVFCKENFHMYTGSTLCSVDNAGYIYICVNFHNIIKVISKENKLCTMISVNRPRSVSIYQNELYVVSFNSDLQSDVVNVYSIGKKASKKAVRQITFDKIIHGHIYCLCVVSSGDIVICDWSDEVQFFSKTGSYLYGFNVNDSVMQDVIGPSKKYMVFKNDFLYISNDMSDNMWVLTSNCLFLKCIYIKGLRNVGQFAISALNEFILPNWLDDEITVHDLGGRFLRSIQITDLHCPHGVAVMPDGRIFTVGRNMHLLLE